MDITTEFIRFNFLISLFLTISQGEVTVIGDLNVKKPRESPISYLVYIYGVVNRRKNKDMYIKITYILKSKITKFVYFDYGKLLRLARKWRY